MTALFNLLYVSDLKTSKSSHELWTVYKAGVDLEVNGMVVCSVTVKFQTFQTLLDLWVLLMSENMQIGELDMLNA